MRRERTVRARPRAAASPRGRGPEVAQRTRSFGPRGLADGGEARLALAALEIVARLVSFAARQIRHIVGAVARHARLARSQAI
jgi:hypothetical protein